MERRLGEGGYGFVSLAREKSTGRRVAIKTINRGNYEEKSQLANEIDILRHIEHPNIVRLYDIYSGPTKVHIAMEYCSGTNFNQRTDRVTY
jgi:serine/threonine protein kinase